MGLRRHYPLTLASWSMLLGCLFGTCFAQAEVWQGLYRAGAEVNSFQPCPGNLVYWVDGNTTLALSLREYALKQSTRPYQPIYVELMGQLTGKVREGSAAGYDDVLRLQSVEDIRLQIPEPCQDLPPEG
jgi:hypothetical protein